MPNLTVKQLLELEQPLRSLLASKLSFELSHRLGRVYDRLAKAIDAGKASHDGLVRKYGEENAAKTMVNVKPENLEKFNAEMATIFEISEEFRFTPIPLSLFKEVQVTGFETRPLQPILVNDLYEDVE